MKKSFNTDFQQFIIMFYRVPFIQRIIRDLCYWGQWLEAYRIPEDNEAKRL